MVGKRVGAGVGGLLFVDAAVGAREGDVVGVEEVGARVELVVGNGVVGRRVSPGVGRCVGALLGAQVGLKVELLWWEKP